MSETLHRPAAISAVPDVATLARGFSIEATPRQIQEQNDLAAILPAATELFVPRLPNTAFSETVAACRVAKAAGMLPVPHMPARALCSLAQLDADLAALAEAGVDTLLLVAGDDPEPLGPFANTLDVLETGLLQIHGQRQLRFAGHPEGHPVADEATLLAAMRTKLDYARATASNIQFISQFAFEAAPVTEWIDRLAAAGIDAPVRAGIPGPAKLRALLGFAMKLGMAKSARALSRKPETARLLFGQWTPEALLRDLDIYRAGRPGTRLAGVHVFAFGGLAHAANWMNAAAEQ
jgi:methylenetetrahydrofolate reductase (NADPH)